ncbi:hypothetical protein GEMRC1_006271 [Eukaryota sp. GEM-RC1]
MPANSSERLVAVTIIDELDVERSHFWKEMQDRRYVYPLYHGKDLDPAMLPHNISELKSDPFRSVAFIVRELGGFVSNGEYYQEFAWANFFRKHLRNFKYFSPEKHLDVIRDAFKLLDHEDAKDLPGFGKGVLNKKHICTGMKAVARKMEKIKFR